MNCRDFLNEFEDRSALSETATLHLNDCSDCRKINGAQTRVWQIIDRFEPVAAPKDFDFRVKARIANSKPSDFQPRFFPVLRYVLPLSLVGLILAFVVFNGIYSLDDKAVPQVAETNFQPPIQKQIPSIGTSQKEQIVGVNDSQALNGEESVANNLDTKPQPFENKKESKIVKDETRFVASAGVKRPRTELVKDSEKTSNSSQDLSLSTARVMTPRGIPNSARPLKNPSDFERSGSITAEQILAEFGIEILSENGKRKVKTIKPNSVAERSGVKVGDLIEAIDGKKVSSEPIPAQTIEVKKLTITRGAEKREILLRNLPN